MSRRALRWPLYALVVITMVALLWQRWGLDSSLVFDSTTKASVVARDDRQDNGGRSVASLRREHGNIVMDCKLQPGYQWPFCGMEFEIGKAPVGVDLSRFDTVRLNLLVTGPEKKHRVRLFVMNHGPRHSNVQDWGSQKIHEIVFDVPAGAQSIEFPLDRLSVAGWWAYGHPLPLQDAGSDIKNVTRFVIDLGVGVEPGEHRLEVKKVEFNGKLVSSAAMQLAIICVWVAAAICALLFDDFRARRTLREVSTKNNTLELEAQEMLRVAQHDPLTGALNRRGLTAALQHRSDASTFALEGRSGMSILLFDIDHFKQINDQFGHKTGDDVLRSVVGRAQSVVQRSDLLARWGGEEFVLVCDGTTSAQAAMIAARVRAAIAGPPEWPAHLKVTCSVGVATLLPGEDFESAVRRADEAMYAAKRSGRDCIVIASEKGHVAQHSAVGDGQDVHTEPQEALL